VDSPCPGYGEVAGSGESGDEPPGSRATDLVTKIGLGVKLHNIRFMEIAFIQWFWRSYLRTDTAKETGAILQIFF
jgi:hypothetical protein